MTITTLSKSKLEYTINQMIIAFENSKELEVSSLTYTTTYKTSYNPGGFRYTVDLGNFDNTKVKLTNFEVRSNGGDIKYKITGKEDSKLINNFTTRILKKICDIENEQFKKVFTSYDTTEERDDRLKELLFEETETETKVETKVEEVEIDKPKKKWWQIW